MEKQNFTFQDKQLADILRNEILKSSVNEVKASPKTKDMSGFEMISKVEKPYISPIMSMSEDVILDFVEEFEVNELATLSDAELNRISEVLGVDANTLFEDR